MHVIRSGGAGDVPPMSALTNLREEPFDKNHLRARQNDWWKVQLLLLSLPAMFVVSQHRSSVLVVTTIDSSTRIAMQARSVRSPGDVICENFHAWIGSRTTRLILEMQL